MSELLGLSSAELVAIRDGLDILAPDNDAARQVINGARAKITDALSQASDRLQVWAIPAIVCEKCGGTEISEVSRTTMMQKVEAWERRSHDMGLYVEQYEHGGSREIPEEAEHIGWWCDDCDENRTGDQLREPFASGSMVVFMRDHTVNGVTVPKDTRGVLYYASPDFFRPVVFVGAMRAHLYDEDHSGPLGYVEGFWTLIEMAPEAP